MRELFLNVVNMSLTASYVILCVILVRLLLKKAPKITFYALWCVVAFRLIIPFSIESVFSFIPRNIKAIPVPYDITYHQSPQTNNWIKAADSFINQELFAPVVRTNENILQFNIETIAYVWILGIVALNIYSLVSVLQLKRQLKNARLIERNTYEMNNLKTPFVFGLIKPKIYLPSGLDIEERGYILLHEQIHIRRKDHIVKLLAFLIMTIHWFNPLVWIAFMLMSTDMELSCDEKVLKVMNEDVKKPYANSLLSLAVGKHILNGSPIAFGEKNIKNRIKNVLKYKKPGIWVIAVCIIIVAIAGIGLMTNPIKKRANDGISTAKQKAHSVIFLNPFYSVTNDTFLNDRKENEYLFSDEIFEIDSVISSDKILVINPKYKEEYVGEQIKVVGDMVIDISNYSSKKCYRVLTYDNNDTGYIIYELDNETWISHWGWYGENKDAWLCEYILRVI